MQKPRKTVQIFENPFLEKFSRVHPITPLVIFAPVVCFFLYSAWSSQSISWYGISTLFGLGLAFWTLAEYLLHRFLFHWIGESEWSKRIHFIIHGNHHEIPDDPTRLVMPPIVSITLSVFFYYGFQFFLGASWVDPFFAGFILGYLAYDYTHFAVHHFRPRTRFGRMVKQNHMHHHFVNPDSRWGVSSPIWDYALGTMGRTRRPAQSTDGSRKPQSA